MSRLSIRPMREVAAFAIRLTVAASPLAPDLCWRIPSALEWEGNQRARVPLLEGTRSPWNSTRWLSIFSKEGPVPRVRSRAARSEASPDARAGSPSVRRAIGGESATAPALVPKPT